jgi:hypothetical protein
VSAIDHQGRVFGRINLVDAAAVLLVLVLIPIGYGTYLLFRPAAPRIDSVEPSVITREEQRISVGGRLLAKFKVRGRGFTPLLRARIGDADALALVFESPTSMDVLVGPVQAGTHDLVLIDGVQEIARARGAIGIQAATASTSIRVAGWLTGLDEEVARAISVGTALPENEPAFRVVALGPVLPGFRRVSLGESTVEIPAPGTHARAAVLTLMCGETMSVNPCTLGERPEYRTEAVSISLPGPRRPFNLDIDEVFPSSSPVRATLRVRLAAGSAAVRPGDRDDLLDERAATVVAVSGDVITLDAGVDRFRDGWRYRGERQVPGGTFALRTRTYIASGVLLSMDIKPAQP